MSKGLSGIQTNGGRGGQSSPIEYQGRTIETGPPINYGGKGSLHGLIGGGGEGDKIKYFCTSKIL